MKNSNENQAVSSVARTIFGIIMIIIYVGMGILLMFNFFDWDAGWNWLRWGGGVLFILYGAWRALRQFKGIDSSI